MVRRTKKASAVAGAVALAAMLAALPAGAAPTVVQHTSLSTYESATVPSSAEFVDVAIAPDGTVHGVAKVRGTTTAGELWTARRRPGQQWEPFEQVVGSAEFAGGLPQLAVDAKGNAAVIFESAGDFLLARRPVGGTWGKARALTSSEILAGAALAAGGDTFVAAWSSGPSSGGGGGTGPPPPDIKVQRFPPSGPPTTPTRELAPGQNPVVAAAPGGRAAVVWSRDGIHAAVSDGGDWNLGTLAVPDGSALAGQTVAMDASGNVAAAWRNGSGKFSLRTRPAGGSWQTPAALTDNLAYDLSIRVDSTGRVVALWKRSSGGDLTFVEGTVRGFTALSSPAITLSAPGISAAAPSLAVDGRGRAMATWVEAGALRASRLARQDANWPPSTSSFTVSPDAHTTSEFPTSSVVQRSGARGVALTPSGDGVLGWTRSRAVHGRSAYLAGYDVNGPKTRLRRPSKAFSLVDPVVAWRAADVWSRPDRYRLRLRTARLAGGFSKHIVEVSETQDTRLTVGGVPPGRTVCFSARATDEVDNTGRYSPERCTALPANDRALSASTGWERKDVPAAYRGTASVAKTKGAALTSPKVEARRIALVATRAPGAGSVDVFLGKQRLERVSLEATKTRRKQVIPIATFTSRRSGVVRIVTRSAKPVAIEGLGISAR